MKKIGNTSIELIKGDICDLEANAIVNAANSRLILGGGVAGAIRRKGGPSIQEECSKIGGTPVGTAAITGAGNLKTRFVIHAVGPVWNGGRHGEAQQLASAYRSSLELAEQHGARSIAFPAISCGVYRYPPADAAHIAVAAARSHVATGTKLQRIVFVCFDDAVLESYRGARASG